MHSIIVQDRLLTFLSLAKILALGDPKESMREFELTKAHEIIMFVSYIRRFLEYEAYSSVQPLRT
jgi:hypothetical protein